MEIKLKFESLENITFKVKNGTRDLVDLVLGIENMKLLIVNNSYFHCLKPCLMFGVSMRGHCLVTIYVNSRLCLKLKATFIKFDCKRQTHHWANDKLRFFWGINYTLCYRLSHVKTSDPIRLIFYINWCWKFL